MSNSSPIQVDKNQFPLKNGEHQQIGDDEFDDDMERADLKHVVDMQHGQGLGCTQPYGITFQQLGPDQKCEMIMCDKPAYACCERPLYTFLYLKCLPPVYGGCGKKLCEDHIEIRYDKLGSPISWHCKHSEKYKMQIKQEKKTGCQTHHDRQHLFNNIIFTIICLILLILLIIYAFQDSNYAQYKTWEKGPTFDVTYDFSKQKLKFEALMPVNTALVIFFGKIQDTYSPPADGIKFIFQRNEDGTDMTSIEDIKEFGRRDTIDNLKNPSFNDTSVQQAISVSPDMYKLTVWRFLNQDDVEDNDFRFECDVTKMQNMFVGTWIGQTPSAIGDTFKDSQDIDDDLNTIEKFDRYDKAGDWNMLLDSYCQVLSNGPKYLVEPNIEEQENQPDKQKVPAKADNN